MAKILVGLMDSYKDATFLIQELVSNGFKSEIMSLISFAPKDTQQTIDIIHTNEPRLLLGRTLLPIQSEGSFVIEGLLSDKIPLTHSSKEQLVDLLNYIGIPESDADQFLNAVCHGNVWLSLCSEDIEIADQAYAVMRIKELSDKHTMANRRLVKVYETPGSIFINEHAKVFGEQNKSIPEQLSNTDVDFISEVREKKENAVDAKKGEPTSWRAYEGPDRRKISLAAYPGINRRMAH